MNYTDFASKISFYEFIQEEFKDKQFNIDLYHAEFSELKKDISIDRITRLLESHPRTIDILESFFQLERFTDAQYIHFCFDVNALNNFDDKSIISYAEKSILFFENKTQNHVFNKLFQKLTPASNNIEYVFNIKKCIPDYIKKIVRDDSTLHFHLINSISSRLRLAKYLIEVLKLDEYVKTVDLEKYLSLKRIPHDTKGIHGKFGGIKIKSILNENKVLNVNEFVDTKIISLTENIPVETFCFVTEKAIQGINVKKTNKPKVFDFIIFYKGLPSLAIETNFYSTSGTKIGINEGEYTDLVVDIKSITKSKKSNLQFMWITDGNYWLSREGEARFNNLKQNYFKDEFELLNYNLFKKLFPKIEQFVKNK